MSLEKDPYASEKETAALLKPDTRTAAEKRQQLLIEEMADANERKQY